MPRLRMVMLAQLATGEIESDMINDRCTDLLLAGTDTSVKRQELCTSNLRNRGEL